MRSNKVIIYNTLTPTESSEIKKKYIYIFDDMICFVCGENWKQPFPSQFLQTLGLNLD